MVNFLVKLWWHYRIDQFSRTNFDDTKKVILLRYFYYYYKFLNNVNYSLKSLNYDRQILQNNKLLLYIYYINNIANIFEELIYLQVTIRNCHSQFLLWLRANSKGWKSHLKGYGWFSNSRYNQVIEKLRWFWDVFEVAKCKSLCMPQFFEDVKKPEIANSCKKGAKF